jgi:hypothetical protein
VFELGREVNIYRKWLTSLMVTPLRHVYTPKLTILLTVNTLQCLSHIEYVRSFLDYFWQAQCLPISSLIL